MVDEIDWEILRILQENGRLPFAELGRQVGLTAPAAAERVRKLEEAGVIRGYHADLDPGQVGLSMAVIVQMGLTQVHTREVAEIMGSLPEVLECYTVTGQDCLILRAVVPDMASLQVLHEHLSSFGRITTSIILSTAVARRSLDPARHSGASRGAAEEVGRGKHESRLRIQHPL